MDASAQYAAICGMKTGCSARTLTVSPLMPLRMCMHSSATGWKSVSAPLVSMYSESTNTVCSRCRIFCSNSSRATATASWLSLALVSSYFFLRAALCSFCAVAAPFAPLICAVKSSRVDVHSLLRALRSMNTLSSDFIVAIFSSSCLISVLILESSVLIFSSSSLRLSSSCASLDDVFAELSIWICLKSRSALISVSFCVDMLLAFSRNSVLREMDCSRRTISDCAAAVFFSSAAFCSSKLSMSSDISLSRAKSSCCLAAFGSSALSPPLLSEARCARPLRSASCVSATFFSASAISALSPFTFCSSMSRCSGIESCGPSSSLESSEWWRSSR
mmetsp:Transcript_10870/g.23172  ORF Transcript_10870/g.23172 Transcript_10870/m.23172 type:complete len:333 (-) Transcript_10870:1025-2023(-)